MQQCKHLMRGCSVIIGGVVVTRVRLYVAAWALAMATAILTLIGGWVTLNYLRPRFGATTRCSDDPLNRLVGLFYHGTSLPGPLQDQYHAYGASAYCPQTVMFQPYGWFLHGIVLAGGLSLVLLVYFGTRLILDVFAYGKTLRHVFFDDLHSWVAKFGHDNAIDQFGSHTLYGLTEADFLADLGFTTPVGGN